MTLHPYYNEDELQQYILRTLGAPQVAVELTQDDLDDAIEQAKRWFAAKKGVKKFTNISVVSGISEYQLPEDVDVVIDVMFMPDNLSFAAITDPLLLINGAIPYNRIFGDPSTMGLFSTYLQSMQYLEEAKKIVGSDLDWRQDGTSLFIWPLIKTTGRIAIQYKPNDFSIVELPQRDHDLIKRFSVAKCKGKLGRIRSRYGSYATAQGPTAQDGERLLTEHDQDMQILEEEIALSGFPMGLMQG